MGKGERRGYLSANNFPYNKCFSDVALSIVQMAEQGSDLLQGGNAQRSKGRWSLWFALQLADCITAELQSSCLSGPVPGYSDSS